MTAGKSTHIVEILEMLFGLCCLFVVSPEATTNIIRIIITLQNVSIAIVGKSTDFKIFNEDEISVYLSQIEDDKRNKPTEPDVEDSKPPQPPSSEETPQDPQVTVAMDTD